MRRRSTLCNYYSFARFCVSVPGKNLVCDPFATTVPCASTIFTSMNAKFLPSFTNVASTSTSVPESPGDM